MEIMRRNAVVKNPGTKQRGQRILGDCWQWKSNGQCSKGDNCSFRHDINKRAKMTQPNSSPNSFMQQNERNASRTRSPSDGPARITSKELAPIHSVKSGTLQNACSIYKTKSGCKCVEKCSYAHRQVDEQPCKRSKTNDDKSTVAMLKKNGLHESIWQPVVNCDKSHDRPGRPDVKRDTCHELKQGPVGRRSLNTRQLGWSPRGKSIARQCRNSMDGPRTSTFQHDAFHKLEESQGKRTQSRMADVFFYRSRPHEQRARGGVPRVVETTKGTLQRQVQSTPRVHSIELIWERHRKRVNISGKADLMPLSFTTQCLLTALKKVVSTKTDVIRIPTPRSLPKIELKEAWQEQRDDHSQRRSGIGKPIADEERFKIDLRVQGVPHEAVLEDEDRTRRIRKLAHSLRSHSRTNAMNTDLRKTDASNPFSEESKKIIPNSGEVELFELREVSAKTQCPSCAKYWPEGDLYSNCGQYPTSS